MFRRTEPPRSLRPPKPLTTIGAVQVRAGTGARLGNRYRLDTVLHRSDDGRNALWDARDEVLGRPVAVWVVALADPDRCEALRSAAERAGRVTDGRWVRMLDLGQEPVDGQPSLWLVREWVEGPSLTALLRSGPLPAPVATDLIHSCAQAVSSARAAGTAHNWLTPDEVLLPADGRPRLTGLEIRRAMSGVDGYDDTRALGALLCAALTGRWPLPGWDGLPPAAGGRIPHRRGVSRELHAIVAKAVGGEYSGPDELERDLAAQPRLNLYEPPPERLRRTHPKTIRAAWLLLPPAIVAAIGYAAWTAGGDLGRVPSATRAAAPSFPQPRQTSGPTVTRVVWSSPPHISSFDPQGDGAEDPGGVGLAVDDDPSTQWSTDTYYGNPRFGGLKQGVGLLLELHKPATVSAARLLLSAPGANLELRAGNHAPVGPTDLPEVASSTDSATSLDLQLRTPVTAKYWLVWLTSLPKAPGGGYRLGIAEIALLH
jgi:hypothetical protein